MKTLIASVFALAMLGATSADAAGINIHVGGGHHGWHRWHGHSYRHCGWRHHHRSCW